MNENTTDMNFKSKSNINAIIAYITIFSTFFLLRIPALLQPYHQDEYKWARAVGFEDFFSPSIPHPPLARFLYVIFSKLFGNEYLRLMPLVLSVLTLLLLFYILRKYHGILVASIGGLLFTIIPYSVIASLQIDIDGAVLPFFSLATIAAYLFAREGHFRNKWHLSFIFIGALCGFFSKLSFIIVPLSLLTHFAYEKYFANLNVARKRFLIKKSLVVCGVLLIFLPIILWLAEHIFIFRYAKNFTHFAGRNYFELFFLSAKALVYLSPILALGLFLGLKDWRRLSLWYFFVIFSLLFYMVVFDFTHRTLDRYLMVLIIPLIVVASDSIAKIIRAFRKKDLIVFVCIGGVVSMINFYILYLPHQVLPLNPKGEFIHAVLSLKWNILIPLSGGSGPLGFYVSLLSISFFWAISVAMAFFVLSSKNHLKRNLVIILLAVSSVYSVFIVSEYLYGWRYGSTPKVLSGLIEYIKSRNDISEVITYNDSGAYELLGMEKYYKRFYSDPLFLEANKEKLSSFKGYYLVLDFPRINKDSFFSKYFDSCMKDKTIFDGSVDGYIFNCKNSKF